MAHTDWGRILTTILLLVGGGDNNIGNCYNMPTNAIIESCIMRASGSRDHCYKMSSQTKS